MDSQKVSTNSTIEKKLLKAPKSDYMNTVQLIYFKDKLLALYKSTELRIHEAKHQMIKPSEGLRDSNDRASWEERASLALRIADREQKLLLKIRQSLQRINSGTYGYCLESDEPIGIARLLARPTAEYSAEFKAIQEHKESQYR